MLLCALLVFSPAHASEGASDAKNRDLIINGISAPETRYPYAVSLQYNRQHEFFRLRELGTIMREAKEVYQSREMRDYWTNT